MHFEKGNTNYLIVHIYLRNCHRQLYQLHVIRKREQIFNNKIISVFSFKMHCVTLAIQHKEKEFIEHVGIILVGNYLKIIT